MGCSTLEVYFAPKKVWAFAEVKIKGGKGILTSPRYYTTKN